MTFGKYTYEEFEEMVNQAGNPRDFFIPDNDHEEIMKEIADWTGYRPDPTGIRKRAPFFNFSGTNVYPESLRPESGK